MVCIGISTWPPLLAHDSLQALPPGLFSLLGVQYVLFVVVIQSLSHVWLFQPQGLQHTRLPCSSLSPGVCLNSCPLNRSCHPTISSSVVPFSSGRQSFPASGSFPMDVLFTSEYWSQSIGASASVLPMNIQGWLPLARWEVGKVWPLC